MSYLNATAFGIDWFEVDQIEVEKETYRPDFTNGRWEAMNNIRFVGIVLGKGISLQGRCASKVIYSFVFQVGFACVPSSPLRVAHTTMKQRHDDENSVAMDDVAMDDPSDGVRNF